MCETTKYFFYIRTSVSLIIWRSRSVSSVNRTVKPDTHQKEKTPTEGGDNTISFYICKSAFWHSTVRICLEISSDGTESHTCKRPPESVIWSFFYVRTFVFLSWDSSDGTGNATCILNIRLMFYSIGFFLKNFVVKIISSYFFNIWKIGVSQTRGLESSMHFIYLFIYADANNICSLATWDSEFKSLEFRYLLL
jgi:hypothetical protein